ncbi:hypothetical protein CMK10_12800 [Candidatus Poribacteria bacterium]|nr:hypothetical protein [Candidatus Poribacteria bacterium]
MLFRENALTPNEVKYYVDLFDQDRQKWDRPNLWYPFCTYQTRNCHALVTSPEFDRLLRHANIFPLIEFQGDQPASPNSVSAI